MHIIYNKIFCLQDDKKVYVTYITGSISTTGTKTGVVRDTYTVLMRQMLRVGIATDWRSPWGGGMVHFYQSSSNICQNDTKHKNYGTSRFMTTMEHLLKYFVHDPYSWKLSSITLLVTHKMIVYLYVLVHFANPFGKDYNIS